MPCRKRFGADERALAPALKAEVTPCGRDQAFLSIVGKHPMWAQCDGSPHAPYLGGPVAWSGARSHWMASAIFRPLSGAQVPLVLRFRQTLVKEVRHGYATLS